jgi:membrane protease YdiL (CAAX protease family)
LAFLTVVNPLVISWTFHHGSEPMAPELLAKAYYVERYVMVLRNLTIVAVVYALAAHQSLPGTRLGMNWNDWQTNVAIGFSFGLMRVALQGSIRKLLPSLGEVPNNPELLSSPTSFWIANFLLGSFAEELWIALCIVVLVSVLNSLTIPILVTGVVFGLVHFGYGFGGFLAIAIYGIISGSLFVWRGSLLPLFLFHFLGNLGVLYWARRAAAPLRRGGDQATK